jgi:hypothetical protein
MRASSSGIDSNILVDCVLSSMLPGIHQLDVAALGVPVSEPRTVTHTHEDPEPDHSVSDPYASNMYV